METKFKWADRIFATQIPKGTLIALGKVYVVSGVSPAEFSIEGLGGGWNYSMFELVRDAHPISDDSVDRPPHYTSHPSGVECIDITEHMNFCLGNAIKYLWRAGIKTSSPVEDLQKAKWYIERELARLEKEKSK